MKNKKILSFRTKAEAVLVVILMVGIVVSAGTITWTDKQVSTDDSELLLNFEDGWINTWNITIDNNSVDNTVINTWVAEPIHNDSDSTGMTWEMADGWNASNPNDDWFNESLAYILNGAWFTDWNASYGWGDHSIVGYLTNESDAEAYDHIIWDTLNATENNPFDQELNESNDVVFNKVTTSNITSSGSLNITSDDAYTRVTGDLNVTGTLSPTLFLIPCYGSPPATVEQLMYFNTGNNSLVVYYDGAWHYHEED